MDGDLLDFEEIVEVSSSKNLCAAAEQSGPSEIEQSISQNALTRGTVWRLEAHWRKPYKLVSMSVQNSSAASSLCSKANDIITRKHSRCNWGPLASSRVGT